MRVDLDAKVQTHDGRHAGSVQRAVIDPRMSRFRLELIAAARLPERQTGMQPTWWHAKWRDDD
jgi:hypothetical protein